MRYHDKLYVASVGIAKGTNINDAIIVGYFVDTDIVSKINAIVQNLIKCENQFYNVKIPANSTSVFNVGGFNGKGITVACIVNSEYDLIQANGHMGSGNTFMRVTATNLHNDEQSINVSAIRLYI